MVIIPAMQCSLHYSSRMILRAFPRSAEGTQPAASSKAGGSVEHEEAARLTAHVPLTVISLLADGQLGTFLTVFLQHILQRFFDKLVKPSLLTKSKYPHFGDEFWVSSHPESVALLDLAIWPA